MTLKQHIKRWPGVKQYSRARRVARLQRENGAIVLDVPGTYSSPIPALNEVRARDAEIFRVPTSLPGIAIRENEQLELVAELGKHASDQPFRDGPTEGLRYHFENPYFRWPDALVLHALLRWARPRRLIEVGSGFSSAAILDTNDRFLDGELSCTFIEPHPGRLRLLLRDADFSRHRVMQQPVQEVRLELFDELESGDVLFVDSSHVVKIGSDVNRLLFDVLPRLRPGVLVHFHDIGWPFEYPREWVYEGRAWNEAYLLRAFLMDNADFEIVLFNHYLSLFHTPEVERHLPLWAREGGGSLWIRRTEPSPAARS